LAAVRSGAETPGPRPGGAVLLHDGWTIRPAGRAIDVGNFPMAVVALPGRRAAVLLCGYGEEGVDVVDLSTGARQRLTMPKAWLGLAASGGGKTIYASGGADGIVRVFEQRESGWVEGEPFRLPASGMVAGLALDEAHGRLYVAEHDAGRLARFDVTTRKLDREYPAGGSPYEVRLDASGGRAFVSNWADGTVSAIPVDGDGSPATWSAGSHPTALLLDPAGERLLVACSADDRVTALDTRTGRVQWNASVTLRPNGLEGTTPTALARAPDGRILVANSDNNDLAVIDVRGERPRVEGFLPTGRYPTAIAVDGDSILVADGKGSVTRAAPDGPQPTDRIPGSRTPRYVLVRQTGDLREIPLSSLERLPDHTKSVLAGIPAAPEEELHPRFRKIRHVIYVIRENRTYDQVLGDDRRGNGDPALVLFGERVTPNAHTIARTFTLLDDFFCNAEVSADGHSWSSAAFANDYVQKTYPQEYSRRGWKYDYDGENPLARPRGGYLWEAAARAGVPFRSYGWFLDLGAKPLAAAPESGLGGHFDPAYRGWDLSYGDLDRMDEWLREFREFEKTGALPGLEIVYLPNDHTSGSAPGAKAPTSMAAENDLALGRMIDAVTHSRYFSDTAVFVLEDDAQNGPDHVDCHRSPVFVVSPYTPRGKVDSRQYSTASVLATIETILRLPPMSQYDEAAPRMAFEFSGAYDPTPFAAVPATVPLDETNPAGKDAPNAALLDFRRPDAVPDAVMNDDLYRAVTGRPSPGITVRFGSAALREDDDGD
ncbi:MAG TPA: bifunctional YncE family protein/alkaline phosphatase family protein, partial [Thermoanaerobaculia bacterium]|nr:bifunctional YncE family protein/alkaline phosphatase family protein [Thermoanaerobaculia bacterium]